MCKIKLPASLKNLDKFIDFVISFTKDQGFDKEQIDRICLCIEEAVVNICNYAYPDNSNGEIEIFLTMKDEDNLIIRIEDEGIPFDIVSHSDPDITKDISERKIGGLGIYLIRQIMSEIRYKRQDGLNILTMIMRRK